MAQGPPAPAAATKKAPVATIRSVRVVRDTDGPAIEILSTGAVIPTIQKLEDPIRLVIDVPNSRVGALRKRVDFRSEKISGIRVDQYQNDPPVTRVVVDLSQPSGFTWDASGNRLMVRLRPAEEAAKPIEPPKVAGISAAPQPAVVPISPGSSGAVVLAGNRISAGSSITAGADAALLHLARGGEVRVCPGTTVSVTPSQNGHDLMLGMSTG